MPGMTRFYNIDYFFLIIGLIIISASLFSQIQYEKKKRITRCSRFTGLVIIGLCYFPSVLLITLFYLIPLLFGRMSWSPSGNLVCFLLPFLLSLIGMILGLLSLQVLHLCPKPEKNKSNQLKKRATQIGLIIFSIGIVFTGVTLSLGMIAETTIDYEITIETTEPSVFYVPIPIHNQSKDYLSFIENLSIVSGNASWTITKTDDGYALKVQTNSSCYLTVQRTYGIRDRKQVNVLFETTLLSMQQDFLDEQKYTSFAYASTNNSTLDLDFSLDSGLGTWVGHDTGKIQLQQGWQLINITKHRASI
jgi:hypothetical protein